MIAKDSMLITKKIKLTALLLLIGLLNLAPSARDCCRNEEDGDPEPSLADYCIFRETAAVFLKPGQSVDVKIGDAGCDDIKKALPWSTSIDRDESSSFDIFRPRTPIADPKVLDPASVQTAVRIQAIIQELNNNQYSIFAPRYCSVENVVLGLVNRLPLSKVSGALILVEVATENESRDDQKSKGKAVSVSPAQINFGVTKIGATSTVLGSVVVLNKSVDTDLNITELVLEDLNYTFSGGPTTIAKGGYVVVPVRFTPKTPGSKLATLFVDTDAAVLNVVRVSLIGFAQAQ